MIQFSANCTKGRIVDAKYFTIDFKNINSELEYKMSEAGKIVLPLRSVIWHHRRVFFFIFSKASNSSPTNKCQNYDTLKKRQSKGDIEKISQCTHCSACIIVYFIVFRQWFRNQFIYWSWWINCKRHTLSHNRTHKSRFNIRRHREDIGYVNKNIFKKLVLTLWQKYNHRSKC